MKFGLFRRKFGKFIVGMILVFFLSVVVYQAIIRFFSIDIIEVVGSDVQLIVDEKRISKNLLFFPSEKFRSEICRDNPFLSDVRFEKQYPHTLKIIPIVRTPFVRLKSDDRLVLLDSDAVVIEDGDRGLSLPLLVLPLSPFRVGQTITDSRITFLLAFVSAFHESIVPINTITEHDSSYFQVKTGKTDIYITQDKPANETIATLQTLIAGFRIKGTLPAVVDLRFDKPIIKI
jgi:hypothetical protein